MNLYIMFGYVLCLKADETETIWQPMSLQKKVFPYRCNAIFPSVNRLA